MVEANRAARTWLITGAASGLGAAMARYAYDQGYNVVLGVRSDAAATDWADADASRILLCRLDVNVDGDANRAVDEAVAKFGAIDVLVNNAGKGLVGALEETSSADFRDIMETNLFGLIEMTRAVLPHFRERRSGAIVNISSIAAIRPNAGFCAYAASKFAVEGLSEALAREVAPFGINVLIAQPGGLRTEFAARSIRHTEPSSAYSETLGAMRDHLQTMVIDDLGDPYLAAAAIDKALAASQPPLRLPLGKDAVAAMRSAVATRLSELDEWATASTSIS